MKRLLAFLLILVMGLGLFSCYEIADPTNPIFSTTTRGEGTTRPSGSSSTSTTTSTTTANPTTSTTSKPTTGTTSSTVGTTTNPDVPKEDPIINPDVDELTLFEELFNIENHISLYLDISNSELKKIQKDYEKYNSMGSKSPIYRMADLHVTITKPDGTQWQFIIEQVGVRMKGNTSRTNFYNDDSGMYNLIHFKISFGETFDEEEYYGSDALVWSDSAARKARKNRTFATLEKIDMRWNKNEDSTHIREHYSYEIYREFGVLAPHTNLASVDIGNDHAGVWLFYEPIDDIFLEKNLPAEALGGDLYKLGWTNEGATFTSFSSYGVEDEDAGKFYVYDLKTNKKTSDHSSLKNLISVLNSNSCNKNTFASVVDVDNFLKFAAISYMMGNPDDLRNNYNNCYIYFRADNGKMMVIPYDVDRGLGVNKDWNPSGNHMTEDSPYNNTAIGNSNSQQKNPLFSKGILNANFYKNEYTEVLKTVASSLMFKISAFEEYYTIAKSLYANDTSTSKHYSNAGWGVSFNVNKSNGANMSYSEYITKKAATLAKYISGFNMNVGTSSNPDAGSNSGSGSGSTPVQKEWELYVRGNFDNNGWSNHEQYKLKHIGDGIYSVTITAYSSNGDAGTFKFKIYNNRENGDVAWYNTVDESKINTSFEYQGSNKNIQVELGTYTIYFDTNTETVYFEKK
ncbi:MAG: CotH kinase family protein [Clostridia bacterium]|nr:CotH kinase family protein [Clostridia bacterium]